MPAKTTQEGTLWPTAERVARVVSRLLTALLLAWAGGAIANAQVPAVLESGQATSGEHKTEAAAKVAATDPGQWRLLITKKLEDWDAFTGIPHKSVKIDGFPQSKSLDCRSGKPFGPGDPKNVFTAKPLADGQLALHVSGEVYAGLSTKEEFENYHFSTEFKWGKKKWLPRKNHLRDSGILVHCTGKHGAFWNAWMRCLECQIQEGDCGDLIQLAGNSCRVRAKPETVGNGFPTHSADGPWCTIGPGVATWGALHLSDREIKNDWNRVEVFAFEDKVVFVINGHSVMHLKDAKIGKFSDGKPLTRGKIQIQSEAAEIWYRNMKIRSIEEMPSAYADHFRD